ncbi:MAG TPA: SUMF1/EgtB/PvdO family nonheme iron enzyme [Saprospiraceae bacterium]|nr:SUMF1/EgtB/PvdO family nonheme iron enzyme [Saprospiraceae bacterium]
MSPTIFINYRISVSSKDALNLHARLVSLFGADAIFMDKTDIKPGDEWPDSLHNALKSAKVVLVVISPGWLVCPYTDTQIDRSENWIQGLPRLRDPHDWVRREIEIAFADPNKTVIPLLFDNADLPKEVELPKDSDLRKLVKKQGYRISDNFDRDFDDFIKKSGLGEIIGLPTANATVPAWQDPHADLPDVLPDSLAPFIGLRHFDEANARLFFGRGLEIQTLTQLIHNQREVRLTLLYGQTGVGKSSLLHAGLFPRLRQHGWQPVYLRRSEVKAEGFHAAFARVLAENADHPQAVFILDQVEEMFADPAPNEAAAFFDCLREALRFRPAAQFILGFRSDFLDSVLKPLSERGLQETYDFRLHRVEPLGEQGIREAILGATQNPRLAAHYDFGFDPELPDLLLRDVLADHNPLAHKAPLLQIQLRKLWDDARALYPNEGRLTIHRELYRKSETLDVLVQQQLGQLEAAWPVQVQSGLALDVLQGFTTPLSTAAVQTNGTVLNAYSHVPDFPIFFNALKNTYLLLEQGKYATRLAHDALAPLIRQRFAASDKPGQRAARILESKKEDILIYRGKGELFTEGDLNLLEKGMYGMKMQSDPERVAIFQCRSFIQQRQADDIRLREQLMDTALSNAHRRIFHLEYAEAFDIILQVWQEGVKTEELRQILLELAFFWVESEHIDDTLHVLARLKDMVGNLDFEAIVDISKDKKALRNYVCQLAERYNHLAFLEERYYPKMIFVAGGEFDMGDEEIEDAGPVHRVTLPSFQIAETPTTNWQYGLYCAATGKNILDKRHSWHIEGDNPVINVSWYDAVAYANWLSGQQRLNPVYNVDIDLPDPNVLDGQKFDWLKATDFSRDGYRLPTEAEWEYAARGGADTSRMTKYAGSDNINEVAWHNGNSKNRTQAVKKLKPNELKLYDMSGNVWEWCIDFYDKNYYEKFRNSLAKNPYGPETGNSAVLRGGSWNVDGYISRVDRRDRDYRFNRDVSIGLRLARAASEGGR